MALLRLTAFATCSVGTNSVTNDRRTGLSNAVRTPLHCCQRQDPANGDVVGQDDEAEHERLNHGSGLGHEQKASLVDPISYGPGPGAENQHRPELTGGQDSQHHPGPGQVEEEQGLGDHRHPGAALADELAYEEQPEVANPQRPERVAPQCGDAHGAGSSSVCSVASASRTGNAARRELKSSSLNSLSLRWR